MPKQIEELQRIFGEEVSTIQINKVKDADHVLDLMREFKVDEVVAVLPLSIIMRLVEKGVYPLYAEMEEVKKGEADYIDERSGKRYVFKGFSRIKGISINKEPLYPSFFG